MTRVILRALAPSMGAWVVVAVEPAEEPLSPINMGRDGLLRLAGCPQFSFVALDSCTSRLTGSPSAHPPVVRLRGPNMGQEDHTTMKRRRHSPEQVIRKLAASFLGEGEERRRAVRLSADSLARKRRNHARRERFAFNASSAPRRCEMPEDVLVLGKTHSTWAL